MVRCSISGCNSDSGRKIDGISFHMFPNDPEIRKLWVTATNRTNWNPTPNSRICSKHFNKDLLLNLGKRKFLKDNSVPTEIETDMENYQRFKMVGGFKKLKKGVVPHKFACQGRKNKMVERPGHKDTQQTELMEIALNPDVILYENHTRQSPTFEECDTEIDMDSKNNIIDPLLDKMHTDSLCRSNRTYYTVGVQANITPECRSKATNTDSDACDLVKVKEEPLPYRSTSVRSSSAFTFSMESFSTEDVTCAVQENNRQLIFLRSSS